MQDVLIAFDESHYKRQIAHLESVAGIIQNVVDTYNTLGLPSLESKELQTLFSDTVSLVFDKMTNGQSMLSIAGIEVDKIKAMDIIIKPVGYDDLLNTVANTKHTFTQIGVNFVSSHIANTFELIDDVVTIKASKDAELQKQNKSYATTERAKSMLALAQAFIAKVDELGLREVIEANPNGAANTLNRLLEDEGRPPLRIDTKGVLIYNDPQRRWA